jgi:hypothetical protein
MLLAAWGTLSIRGSLCAAARFFLVCILRESAVSVY